MEIGEHGTTGGDISSGTPQQKSVLSMSAKRLRHRFQVYQSKLEMHHFLNIIYFSIFKYMSHS